MFTFVRKVSIIAIIIAAIAVPSAIYTISPYFTESTIDEEFPMVADTMMDDDSMMMDDSMMDDSSMMDDTMMGDDDSMMDDTMMTDDEVMNDGPMMDTEEPAMSEEEAAEDALLNQTVTGTNQGLSVDGPVGNMMASTEGMMVSVGEYIRGGELSAVVLSVEEMRQIVDDLSRSDVEEAGAQATDIINQDIEAMIEELTKIYNEMEEKDGMIMGLMGDLDDIRDDLNKLSQSEEEIMKSEMIDEMITGEESMDDGVVLQSMGSFVGVNDGIHNTEGTASIYAVGSDQTVLRLEDFYSTNGPDLKVYLATDKSASDYVNLGDLKANRGNQNYDVSEDIDLVKYDTVLIWCEPFKVLFGSAEISPAS